MSNRSRERRLAEAVLVALLLAVAYKAYASYLPSPQGMGLQYPNPGHHPGEIGPGIFNCSGAINCFWKFPAKVIVEGILDLTGHDILGVGKVYAEKAEVDEVEAGRVNASEVCIGGKCRSGWPSGESDFMCRVNMFACHWRNIPDCGQFCTSTATCNPGEVIVGVKRYRAYYPTSAYITGVKCCKEVCGKPAKLSEYFYNLTGKTRDEVNAEIASKEPGYHWCTEAELSEYPLIDQFGSPGEKFQQGYDKNDFGAVESDGKKAKICSEAGECYWVWLHNCSEGVPCDAFGRCCKEYRDGCRPTCPAGWSKLESLCISGWSDPCDSDNHCGTSCGSYTVDWFEGELVGRNCYSDAWWYNDFVALCYKDDLMGGIQLTRLWLCPNQ